MNDWRSNKQDITKSRTTPTAEKQQQTPELGPVTARPAQGAPLLIRERSGGVLRESTTGLETGGNLTK